MNHDDRNNETTALEDDRYPLKHRDQRIVSASILLLNKLVQAPFTGPAQLVSVAKMLHVLRRLPEVTEGVNVRVSVVGPRRRFEDREIYHWWDIGIEDGLIEISSGGHFYQESTGGDTFTCMQWSAEPGGETNYNDYLNHLRIVDDAQPFDREVNFLDLSQPGYSLEVTDEDNSLLDEELGDKEEELPPSNRGVQLSAAEQAVAATSNPDEALERREYHPDPPEECDFCGCKLEGRSYFVDGRLRGSLQWANMCAECFGRHGEDIGWGKGQLYAKQPNGTWLLTGGFPPEEET
jgi:hypothetical protein